MVGVGDLLTICSIVSVRNFSDIFKEYDIILRLIFHL
jgi:hypothetical protein